MTIRFPSADSMERWPRPVRALLGCGAAGLAAALTYWIVPFRFFPLLLVFPSVILSAWFLGMWGAVFCALTAAVLIDLFLVNPLHGLSIGEVREQLRLIAFLLVSTLLGWTLRKLSHQRSQLDLSELQQRLKLVEERARAAEAMQETEALLHLSLRANGMGLWVWDLERDTIFRSDEVFRMVGCEPKAFEQDPAAWLTFVHPEDREGLTEAFAASRENGVEYHKKYRVVWRDGSEHWLESQGKCQRNSDGKVNRIFGVMADITHRVRAEEAMLQAEKLALAGRLAASVAHEINNPLEAVTNLLYLISFAETLEEGRARAEQALEELMRVSQITQQTLRFHRQGGGLKLISLAESFEALLTLFRAKLQTTQIEVEVRKEREMKIACIPGEIQQIFANLLSNAIEAMPRHGKLVVRFRSSRDWRDGRTTGMRVTFCDSGIGMDRVTIVQMFDPFFTTKKDTGTGLGMWVVSQLVERHQGNIRVWSSQRAGRQGTAFSLFLPSKMAIGGKTAEIQNLETLAAP